MADTLDVKYEFERWMSQQGESAIYIGDGLYSRGAVCDQADAFRAGVEIGRADALASRPAEVDDWIKLSEQKPEVGESVLVWSDSWGEPMVLRYRVQPWESLLDSEQGRWFWYPDRMLWKRFAAPSHTTNKEK